MDHNQSYCRYYQAYLNKPDAWFVTAILKELGHVSLDRTLNVEDCLTEFYVPESQVPLFLSIMSDFISQKLVAGFTELPNRLKDPTQEL